VTTMALPSSIFSLLIVVFISGSAWGRGVYSELAAGDVIAAPGTGLK